MHVIPCVWLGTLLLAPRLAASSVWSVDDLTRKLAVFIAPAVTGGLAVAMVVWRQPRGALSRHLSMAPLTRLAITAVAASVVWLALNAVGLAPFTWRWPEGAGGFEFMRELVTGQRWALVATYIAVGGLAIPLVEEVVFRHVVLLELRRLFRRDGLAIVLTASLFVGVHFWFSWRLSPMYLVFAFWGFCMSLLVASISLRRPQGGLAQAWLVHAAGNTLDLGTLLLVIAVPA